MIIDHNHPLYKEKRNRQGYGKYNGAYYYSKDIVKYIIPNIKTDRNWITIRLPELIYQPNHSIVFIHNNRNPNLYEYLKKYNDMILVCSTKHCYDNMKFFSDKVIYLPLSVNVKSVEKYRLKNKDKDMAFAGRRLKINNYIPKECDILTDMPQTDLIKAMSHYRTIFAVGRTAIQAKILGAKIGVYDNMYPDPNFWKIVDCSEAVNILQQELDIIDGVL